jgi:hypothetical protein
MAELEHLAPADLVGLYSGCLSALTEGRPHATAVLDLVPPCLLLIPPGAPESASQGDGGARCAADAVEGGDGAPHGTPPAEASACHRQAAVHRLLHAEWRADQVGALLAVAREIRLRPAEAKEAVRKAINCARCAGGVSVPLLGVGLHARRAAVAQGCLKATHDPPMRVWGVAWRGMGKLIVPPCMRRAHACRPAPMPPAAAQDRRASAAAARAVPSAARVGRGRARVRGRQDHRPV